VVQLIVGDYGLSGDEERVQMGLWSMFASQLLMSVDLRSINAVSKALLLNRRVLAINQDPLGLPGRHVLSVSTHRHRVDRTAHDACTLVTEYFKSGE